MDTLNALETSPDHAKKHYSISAELLDLNLMEQIVQPVLRIMDCREKFIAEKAGILSEWKSETRTLVLAHLQHRPNFEKRTA